MTRNPAQSVGESRPSERDREILLDVVHTFIETGEPVSSGSVAASDRHGLCSATIRSVMSELEECGFLYQPHVSAGRVPTTAGYHFYIDSLSDILAIATRLLNHLSNQIGVLLAPSVGESTLKALHFVRLSGHRVLCVLESVGGMVEHREIETHAPLTREELTRISNFLTDRFSGLSLREIRDRLLQMMREDHNALHELLSSAATLAQRALISDDPPHLIVEGTTSMIGQPELSDVERVKRLLETFADKAELVQILNRILESPGPHAIIGDDSDLTSDLGFSLVATTYSTGSRCLGTLGIFGPSRMPYHRVVPLVGYLGRTVSEVLESENRTVEADVQTY
ncbi:MAG: hypothetical protein P8Y44_00320 [Acidobacteriota bacterium]